MRKSIPLELTVFLYLLAYLPNIIITKLVTKTPVESIGRSLNGLETLPSTLILNLFMTLGFIWLFKWYRDANQLKLVAISIPIPGRYTFISGIGTALVLFTVPLSFTIDGVSIPFIQLLMRGDILIIAPLVDLMFRRRVRWWSCVALVMVLIAVLFVVHQRGNFYLPPLAIATVVLYTLGYFIRLAVMTKVSKSGEPASIRKYFVEEKLVALPLSVAALGLLAASGIGSQADSLTVGFVKVWSDPIIWKLALSAFTLTVVSVFAAMILLNERENSYCVPMERSASLVAGVIAAYLLAKYWAQPMPTTSELIGALILIAAIVLLSVAPRRFGGSK